MKKLLIVIGLIGALASASAQEFLSSNDYVYGMGTTDNEAVMSLSTSISVAVTSEISYAVREVNKSRSEDFSKNVGLSSSILIPNSKQYIDNRGIYYRFINKREYVENKRAEFNNYYTLALELDGSGVKHELNQRLGYYYLAYQIMNEPLMRALAENESEMLRQDVLKRAEALYTGNEYGVLVANEKTIGGYYVKVSGGRRVMSTFQPADLFGFKFLEDGEWNTAIDYYSSIVTEEAVVSLTDTNNIINKVCRVFSSTPYMPYRINYETVCNGQLVEIPVPEEWHFGGLKVQNPRFLK